MCGGGGGGGGDIGDSGSPTSSFPCYIIDLKP